MTIKINGVCVKVTQSTTQTELNNLLNVCKLEASTASGSRQSFIYMIIDMISSKLTKENYINQINTYEKKHLELS